MRILVTGAAGFIGSHVVDLLVEVGHDVVGVDALLTEAHDGTPPYVSGGAAFHRLDLRDREALRRVARGVEAVSHQASMVGLGTSFADVTRFVDHNDSGTANLLRVLFESGFEGSLVLAGSMVVYGEGLFICPDHGDVRPAPRSVADLAAGRFEPGCPRCAERVQAVPVTEDAACLPRSVYAATKLHQEHLCEAFAGETGVPLTILRYHNVYGARMPADTPYAGVASILRSAYRRGVTPRVFEDGRQLRDFIHVSDVARANMIALDASDPVAGVFNIATGEPHTVGDMARVLGAQFPDAPDPTITGEYRMGDVRHIFASPQRAREELGFSAQVGFDEGMARFATDPLRAPVGA